LGLETHVKHAISLIEHEVLDVGEADASALNEIDETTGGRTQEITSALDETELLVDVRTTVDDGGTHPGAVRKLASLIVNLGNKLTGGREDESGGERLAGP
jgi:hypothetical protein